MNETANAILALGALPVMAHAREEVARDGRAGRRARAQHRHALRSAGSRRCWLAGEAANERGIPVVLDPVGAGATAYRTETARRILDGVDVDGPARQRRRGGDTGRRRRRRCAASSRSAAAVTRPSWRERPPGRSESWRRSPGRWTRSPTGRARRRSRTVTSCSPRSPAPAACPRRSRAASSPAKEDAFEAAVEALVAFGVAGRGRRRRREGPRHLPRQPLRRARGARPGRADGAGAAREALREAARARGGRGHRAAGRRGRRHGRAAPAQGRAHRGGGRGRPVARGPRGSSWS